jgi:hypothetical protein
LAWLYETGEVTDLPKKAMGNRGFHFQRRISDEWTCDRDHNGTTDSLVLAEHFLSRCFVGRKPLEKNIAV